VFPHVHDAPERCVRVHASIVARMAQRTTFRLVFPAQKAPSARLERVGDFRRAATLNAHARALACVRGAYSRELDAEVKPFSVAAQVPTEFELESIVSFWSLHAGRYTC
jgi:hypothetical protein